MREEDDAEQQQRTTQSSSSMREEDNAVSSRSASLDLPESAANAEDRGIEGGSAGE